MGDGAPQLDKQGRPLSEKLFLLLIMGSLVVVASSFSVRQAKEARTAHGTETANKAQFVTYLTHARDETIHGEASGLVAGSASNADGWAHGSDGAVVAPSAIESSEGKRGQRGARATPSVQTAIKARQGAGGSLGIHDRPLRTVPLSDSDSRSVFVPSRLGLPLHLKGAEVWSGWPDVNRANITGTAGTEVLEAAFQLVARSRAYAIARDLYRKGIPILFGAPSDFTGKMDNAIAFFHSSPDEAPASGAPETLPEIRFNPLFADENPKVLAAALVHEATHFQQFLDGSLSKPSRSNVDLEFQAWWNEAAFWDEARAEVWPINTFLEGQAELAYRTALRGEAALRDLLAALHDR